MTVSQLIEELQKIVNNGGGDWNVMIPDYEYASHYLITDVDVEKSPYLQTNEVLLA